MAIDGARIQRITSEGLYYLDDTGEEVFISFAECYERQLAEFMEPEHLKKFREANPGSSEEQLAEFIERRKEYKTIADRNSIGGEPMGSAPYIEFYTDPPTRFVFKTSEAFNNIQSLIEFLSTEPPESATKDKWEAFFAGKTGWLTYDLS